MYRNGTGFNIRTLLLTLEKAFTREYRMYEYECLIYVAMET